MIYGIINQNKMYRCTRIWTTFCGELQSLVISYNAVLNRDSDALQAHFSAIMRAGQITNMHRFISSNVQDSFLHVAGTVLFYCLIYSIQ